MSYSRIGMLILVACLLMIVVPIAVRVDRESRTPAGVAMGQVGRLHTAQAQFHSEFGRWAVDIEELGDLIPADLRKGTSAGYRFTLKGSAHGYTISAVPITFGQTEGLTFFSDETLIMRSSQGGEPATAASGELKP